MGDPRRDVGLHETDSMILKEHGRDYPADHAGVRIGG